MKRFISRKRGGFTLLEVLVSTSVIMIGVFGIAGAIALSQQLVKQSFRSDMAANCGRAALATMVAQNWLDDFDVEGLASSTTYNYNWNPGFGSQKSKTNGNLLIAGFNTKSQTEDFDCVDHLRQNNVNLDLEQNPPNYDLDLTSDYTWVGTIRKINGCDYCEVSAAVTYKRFRSSNGNYGTARITGVSIEDHFGVLSAQGTLAGDEEEMEQFKAGQYVYLTNSGGTFGHWYRIDNLFAEGSVMRMQLHGPRWPDSTASNASIVTPGGVVAVYSRIVPIQGRNSWSDR